MRMYSSARCREAVPSLEEAVRAFVQLRALLEQRVDVLGHEARAGRRVGVRERIERDPGIERDLELRAEPAFVQSGELIVPIARRLDPRVERGDVEEALLAAERERLVGLDPGRGGPPVELGLPPVPPRRLVAAPGGRDRDDPEEDRLRDLDDQVRAGPRGARQAVFGREVLRDLGVEVLRHALHPGSVLLGECRRRPTRKGRAPKEPGPSRNAHLTSTSASHEASSARPGPNPRDR